MGLDNICSIDWHSIGVELLEEFILKINYNFYEWIKMNNLKIGQ